MRGIRSEERREAEVAEDVGRAHAQKTSRADHPSALGEEQPWVVDVLEDIVTEGEIDRGILQGPGLVRSHHAELVDTWILARRGVEIDADQPVARIIERLESASGWNGVVGLLAAAAADVEDGERGVDQRADPRVEDRDLVDVREPAEARLGIMAVLRVLAGLAGARPARGRHRGGLVATLPLAGRGR